MHIVFVRHGERRKGETDPELTSAGRRMAVETGRWIVSCDLTPTKMITTATRRTQQTVAELQYAFGQTIQSQLMTVPDTSESWSNFVSDLYNDNGPDGVIVVVGHHPTTALLKRIYGPFPSPIPIINYASAVVLTHDAGVWRCSSCWAGRP